MRVKKIVRAILLSALILLGGYTGICCGATLNKALGQPYLLSGGVKWHFTGFYILSAGYGLLCLLCIALFIVAVRIFRKKKG